MCGIAGNVSFGGLPTVNDETLQTMVDTLIHRGPDESGRDIYQNVAMGMRRLSIIDLAGGSQPIYNSDRTIWTVYNGEIYNYRELRQELRSLGYRFTTDTDTEVIVHGYQEWGAQLAYRLNGMFAIAIHDIRNEKILLIRDQLGIKPLFYMFDGQNLCFGSEIKALLASRRVSRELNTTALVDFMSWEYIPGKNTLFKSIRKLEAGHYIEVDLNQPKVDPKCYWDIPLSGEIEDSFSDRDWQEAIDQQIRKSTKAQMVSDVPLGAFLSGGVDSSLITANMPGSKTFSIGFEDPSYNELEWASLVSEYLGVDHHSEIIVPDALGLFSQLMHFMEDPIGDFSIFPTYLVSKLARKHVTVALSGDGGDELFGGYETYLAQGMASKYNLIPGFIRRGIIEKSINSLKPTVKKKGLINKAKRFLEGFEQPTSLKHTRWRIFLSEIMRQQLFQPDVLDSVEHSAEDHIERLFSKARNLTPLNQCLYTDVKSYLVDNILTKVDRMSMAVSLETRVPFLDPDLVELAFKMPDRLKVSENQTKVLLKKVASKYIPKKAIYRPKEGFSIPMKHWLNTEFSSVVDELLDTSKIRADGVFQASTIERLKTEHRRGVANHSHILWSIIVFQDWKVRWLGGQI